MSGPRLVVKLGGSFTASARLGDWLARIAASRGVLLVPGGGPFADAVRATQPLIGYDEEAAHDMAMMAMAQFGRALVSLAPALELAASLTRIASVCGRGGIAVAVPWPMLAAEPSLPRRWDVTSDAIALWLARHFATPLLVIKQVSAEAGATPRSLAAAGVIDRFFPVLAEGFAPPIHLAGPADVPAAPALDPASLPGRALGMTAMA